jgi:hypothetical protein
MVLNMLDILSPTLRQSHGYLQPWAESTLNRYFGHAKYFCSMLFYASSGWWAQYFCNKWLNTKTEIDFAPQLKKTPQYGTQMLVVSG